MVFCNKPSGVSARHVYGLWENIRAPGPKPSQALEERAASTLKAPSGQQVQNPGPSQKHPNVAQFQY